MSETIKGYYARTAKDYIKIAALTDTELLFLINAEVMKGKETLKEFLNKARTPFTPVEQLEMNEIIKQKELLLKIETNYASLVNNDFPRLVKESKKRKLPSGFPKHITNEEIHKLIQ